jgi:KAP family P-loop domain
LTDPFEYTDSTLKRWGPGGTAYQDKRQLQTPAASSLNDQIESLRRDIAQLNAIRQKPDLTSMSSSALPLGEPDGRPKTSQQIELENRLAELVRESNQGTAAIEGEAADRATFEGRVAEDEAGPEQPRTALQDVVVPPPDPLAPARNHGARLDDLLAFTWPGTQDPYVSANLGRLLRIAATRVDAERILRPRHVFDVVLHEQIEWRLSNSGTSSTSLVRLPDLLRRFAGASDTGLGHFDFPAEEVIATSAAGVAVGPELVAVLLRASLLRGRTNVSYRDAGVRHFLAAFVLEEIGRTAIDAAGLARPSFSVLRDGLAEMIEGDAPHYADAGDDPKSWLAIVAEMRAVTLPHRSAGETHAFANDRTDVDLLGTGRDAAALADLLLLDELVPPVAVGVFGPWGSGKSTLIRLVQQEITAREAAVPKVAQINFDAWSYADAENLWASLTAELFDQLADTIDGREPDGKLRTGLITEIAKRLRKDAEASPMAAGDIESQRENVRAAETKLVALEHEPVAATVAGEMANELIAAATPKQLSADDKKQPDKVREAEKAEENRKRLDELLQACGVPKGERDPEKLAPILSGLFDLPGRSALPFVLLRRSVGRGAAYGLGAALAVLMIGAGGVVWHLGWGRIPEIWAYVVSSLPSLAVLGTLVGAAGVAIRTATPILRLAADFLARKEKRAAELNRLRREAAEVVKTAREKLDAMVAEQKKATEFAASYSVAAEGRSREGLLRYFIAFSPELAEVRKKLGLLATIRRCFETLEQIMREKHEAAPVEGRPTANTAGDTPSAGTAVKLAHVPDVRRIIVYIDDLDRCTENQVVQVLQAIHLLLAFDLFVVIVTVDARWLHRAVGQVYRGQLAAPDEPAESGKASVADYLEKIFQLPIWMQSIGNPAMVDRFVSGIDKPETKLPDAGQRGAAGERGPQGGGTIAVVDAKPDPAILQTSAQRRSTMSELERRALAAMASLAGKSPRGLKRLVNTYRLIRVMRGPAGIVDLEQGGAAKIPLYPYLLFALACEVGLTTEAAALVAEVAVRSEPHKEFHPLVVCLFDDKDLDNEDLDDVQARLRERLDAEGARDAVLTAARAVYLAAAGHDPSQPRVTGTSLDSVEAASLKSEPAFADRNPAAERFAEAFTEAARFTFRPRSR